MPTKVTGLSQSSRQGLTLAMLGTLARRRRYLAVSVLSWIVIVVLTILLVIPQINSILTTTSAIAEKDGVLADKTAYSTALAALSVEEMTRQTTIVNAALPQQKPVLPLLYSVDKIALQSQVAVSNFEVSPGLVGTTSGKLETTSITSSISPDILALPLKMDVSGAFESLNVFFKALDDVVPFIQVNSVDFATADKGDGIATRSAQYSAQVELSSLYAKPKSEVTGPAQIRPLTAQETALLDRLSRAYEARQADALAQSALVATSSGRLNIFAQ